MSAKGKKEEVDNDFDELDLMLNPDLPKLNKFEEKEDLTPYKQFQIRPDFENKFKTTFVKEEIANTLHVLLTGKSYSDEEAPELSKHIADHIRNRIEKSEKIYSRYKIVVNVILGENKGAGAKCGARCLWDPECDALVSEHFINESLFCIATVYGILFY